MPDDQTTIVSSPATATPPPAGDAPGLSPETPSSSGGTTARRRWLSRRRAALWGKRLFALSATLSTMLVAGWFVFLLGQATFRRHTVDLEPLAVPKVLDEAGFSSKVATYRLLDAIRVVQGTGRTTMHQTAVDTPADLSGVVIPKAGISVDSVAASLRSILPGGWRHEISGEFTAAGSRLDLLLRLNGRKLFSVSDAGPDAADRLIALGALIVVANTQPYVAASYLCETNKAAALAAAVQIIAALPPRDENVARAYNMEGIIAEDQGRVDEAVRIYQQTIHDYPHFAIPYNNLGVIWANQHRTEDAIAEYRAAIRLDPKYASPHYNLGFALRELAESGGPSNRTRRLLDACAAFTAGAKLAADDPDYQRQMRMTDTLLAGKGHCPPK